MNNQINLSHIRIITISGRIGAGATTLAKNLASQLSWKHIEGGEIFWEAVRKKLKLEAEETNLRPDEEDKLFDAQLNKILQKDTDIILETKLAGFFAEDIEDVFKILVVCEDEKGEDHLDIRIDRLMNRENISVEKAKEEVIEREKNDIEKWRKLYVNNDQNWVYWDKKYYDLVINTFNHNKEETLKIALEKIGFKR